MTDSDTDNLTQTELIALLQQGSDAWNSWQSEHTNLPLDFSAVDFGAEATLVANFSKINFNDNTNFKDAVFSDNTNFEDATFGDYTNFVNVAFGDNVNFKNATFGDHTFFGPGFDDQTVFGDNTNFENASFGHNTLMQKVAFGHNTNFYIATFGSNTSFVEATFGNNTSFKSVVFGDKTNFFCTIFSGDAIFQHAVFGNNTCFESTRFGKYASFYESTFGLKTVFKNAMFTGPFELSYMTYEEDFVLDSISIEGRSHWLSGTNLSGASILDVDFRHVVLKGAILDGANMLGAQNLKLDSTSIRHTRFNDNAKDHWSVLRRVYTGPNMIITLLFLVAFSLPYFSEVAFWSVINKSQSQIEATTSELGQSIEEAVGSMRLTQTQIDQLLPTLEQLKHRSLCLSDDCQGVRVWELLVGLDKGIGVMLFASSIILFNVLKAFITFMVIPMREQEERSGYSPALRTSVKLAGGDSLKDAIELALRSKSPLSDSRRLRSKLSIRWGYEPYYKMHLVVKALFWVSLVAFIWNTYHWLSRTIWIPS